MTDSGHGDSKSPNPGSIGAPPAPEHTRAPALGRPSGADHRRRLLALGPSRNTYGSVPLPFDLGAVAPALRGCLWQTSILVAFGGATDAAGNATLPLPIPNNPTLEALSLYAQALVLRPGSEQSSNGLAISVGF